MPVFANLCQSLPFSAILCGSLRFFAILCESLQISANLCDSRQFSAKLMLNTLYVWQLQRSSQICGAACFNKQDVIIYKERSHNKNLEGPMMKRSFEKILGEPQVVALFPSPIKLSKCPGHLPMYFRSHECTF